MSFDFDQLCALLPAIYRTKDAQAGGPMASLLSVLASQIAVLEEDLNQFYDDQFIETCAPWVVPYLGDLVGSRGALPAGANVTARADVARTIAYRRRKGTAAVLEQLAQDVTGWPAKVVEYFQLTSRSSHMNHLRQESKVTCCLRNNYQLADRGGPFDEANHTVDLRSIDRAHGRYNTRNLGIHLWRLRSFFIAVTPFKFAAAANDGRFLFNPLGFDTQLFVRPGRQGDISALAQKHELPQPLTRLEAFTHLDLVYGQDQSVAILVDGTELPESNICICDLSSAADGSWFHRPNSDRIAIDPELGRLYVGEDFLQRSLSVVYWLGQPAAMGGGTYERAATFDSQLASSLDGTEVIQVPIQQASLSLALQALGTNSGIIEITDNQSYSVDTMPPLHVNQRIEVRAANGCRPVIELTTPWLISGQPGSILLLNGLVVTGSSITVPQLIPGEAEDNRLAQISLTHCTLVPGISLELDGEPTRPNHPSLIVESSHTHVALHASISGPCRLSALTKCDVIASIVDAASPSGTALANLDGAGHGGDLTIVKSTIFGQVFIERVRLLKNSIFAGVVNVVRKQAGCCAFCYLPGGSRTPTRFRCQPEMAVAAALELRKKLPAGSATSSPAELVSEVRARVRPSFVSERYGRAAYAQLANITADEIKSGADDESEMGAYHDLFQPQRLALLRAKLQEYTRLGMEFGIFCET